MRQRPQPHLRRLAQGDRAGAGLIDVCQRPDSAWVHQREDRIARTHHRAGLYVAFDHDRVEGRPKDVMVQKRRLEQQRGFGVGTLCDRDLHLAFGHGKLGFRDIDVALRLFGGLRRDRAAFDQRLLARIGSLALFQYRSGA